MRANLENALMAAEADWKANVGEHNRRSGSGIDKIFIESTWNKFGVPKEAGAKIPDWCGMAVVTWLFRAGFNPHMRSSFLHTFNIAAFFTYGRIYNVNPARLDVFVQLSGPSGPWTEIEAWHRKEGQARRWIDRDEIGKRAVESVKPGKADKDLFQPGDVVLIDWSRRDDPDHITLCRSWDGRTLELIEGNASGLAPDGTQRKDAVIVRKLDLSKAAIARLVFGVGRLSPLDFGSQPMRERRPGDPAITRGA